MCTFANGKLIAYTGTSLPARIEDPVPKQPRVFSGEREPIRFDERSDEYRGGTRDKCSRHNCGRKPDYKDKHAPGFAFHFR